MVFKQMLNLRIHSCYFVIQLTKPFVTFIMSMQEYLESRVKSEIKLHPNQASKEVIVTFLFQE